MLEIILSSVILYLATVYVSQNHQLQPHRFVVWMLATVFILILTALLVAAVFEATTDIVVMAFRGMIIISVPVAFLFFVLKNQFYVESVKERVIILSIYGVSFTLLSLV